MKFTAHSFTRRVWRGTFTLVVAVLAIMLAAERVAVPALAQPAAAVDAEGFPTQLVDTGLFVDAVGSTLRPGVMRYAPQYPLWSDDAAKQRWIYLPPGKRIDARDPDAWEFPVGTRLWKSFAHDRVVETRFIERRADGQWHFAVYVWKPDGSDATLVPARGLRGVPVDGAPGGRYDIPSRSDCTACHEGAAVPVLGFSALQLAAATPGRASAVDEIDLGTLIARGLIEQQPAQWRHQLPTIAATSPAERAALGYLHGNCGHCHNDNGSPAPVGLVLAQRVADVAGSRASLLRSAVNAPPRYRPTGEPAQVIVAPAQPEQSVLLQRMRSRQAARQMPPLGTRTVDTEGLALVERWISQLTPTKEHTP